MRDQTNIDLHGFDDDGQPVFTIERSLAGRRNRHLRRIGAPATENIGRKRDVVNGPMAAPLMQVSRGEIWGFAGGHVYRVEQKVDGVDQEIFIDALEGHEVVSFVDGIQLESWAFDVPGDEDLPDQEDVDDESDGDEESETPVEPELPVREETPAPEAPVEAPVEEAPAAEVPVEATPEVAPKNSATTDGGDSDTDDDSASDKDYPGVISHFEEHIAEVSDEELLRLSDEDHRVGIRDRALEELGRRTSTDGDPED